VVPGTAKVVSATLLATGKKLAVKSGPDSATVTVPAAAPDKLSSTIVLKVKAPLAAN
jgi:alpha-L-fucosidase